MYLPTAPTTRPRTIHGGAGDCQKSTMTRGRKGLTVRLSVCSMNMQSFVGRIRALPVTATQRTTPPPMPSIRNIWIKSTNAMGRWRKPTRKASGTSLRKRQGNTEPMSGRCGTRCIPKSPNGAGNTIRSRKTKIWNDKEV